MLHKELSPDTTTLAGSAEDQEQSIYQKWIQLEVEQESKNTTSSYGLEAGRLYFCLLCDHVWERAYCGSKRTSYIYKYSKALFGRIFLPKQNRNTVCPHCVGELEEQVV